MQPAQYTVSRSTSISAAPGDIFPLVNDFHNWDGWSPWAKIDPAMKVTYEGPPAGNGAIYSWKGNSQVGEGRMNIIDSKLNNFVRINLQFFKPFAGAAVAEYKF